VNLYAYAGNDPISYDDPFGLLADCKWENGRWVGACTFGERTKIFGANVSAGLNGSGCADNGPGCPTGRVLGFAAMLLTSGLAEEAGAAELGTAAGRSESLVNAAASGEGNFGMGLGTAEESDAAGKAFVGDGYTTSSDGSLMSKDKLRQYRGPSFKPKLGKTQANFESRSKPSGKWTNDGHLDITPPPGTI
jgi:hypothetical protein